MPESDTKIIPTDPKEARKFQATVKYKKEQEELSPKGKLNPKQEAFCKLYATDQEFFGNGVQSYIEVYGPDMSKPNWYKTACAAAAQLLSNIKVFSRINDLLEETGFNDAAVDKQLSFLIHQQADFPTKAAAIREYNKLKKRIDDKKDQNNPAPVIVISFKEFVKPDETWRPSYPLPFFSQRLPNGVFKRNR